MSMCIWSGMPRLLLYLHPFVHIIFLVFFLYLFLSLYILLVFYIWAQIQYGIDISTWYVLNYLCPSLSWLGPPWYILLGWRTSTSIYQGVFIMSIAKAFLPTGRASGCHTNSKAAVGVMPSLRRLIFMPKLLSVYIAEQNITKQPAAKIQSR